MNKYNLIERYRIKENRDFKDGLFLNRVEKTEPWSDEIINNMTKNIDFNKIGYYYDLDILHEKYSNYLNVNKNQMLMTNGADESIRYIYQIFTKENDNIMFPKPTYGLYSVYTKMYKCNSIELEYDNNFKINREKLYKYLNKIRVFFLPNPNHSQDIFEENEIIKIIKILDENNGVLVVDETYFGFGGPSMINLLDSYKNLFVIRSFSKTFGLPGIRFGCLLSNKEINISNFRGGYEVSYITYKIAEYFLDNISIINNYIEKCIEGRTYLIKYLNNKNIRFNGDRGYIFNIILKDDNEATYIHNKLFENKIYVRLYNNTISITICPICYINKFILFWNSIMNNLYSTGILKISNIIDNKTCEKIINFALKKNNIDFEPYSESPYRSSITLTELNNIDNNIEIKLNNLIHQNLSKDFYIHSVTVHYKDKWIGAEEQWHQDYYYNLITHDDDPTNFYRLFIALDEHTKENGCMLFMNGSHKERQLDYNKILSIHSYQKNRTHSDSLDKCYEKYGVNYYPLNKGDGLLFNSLILHSSGSNQSPNPRRAIQIQIIKKGTKEKNKKEIDIYKSNRKKFEIEELQDRIYNKKEIKR